MSYIRFECLMSGGSWATQGVYHWHAGVYPMARDRFTGVRGGRPG